MTEKKVRYLYIDDTNGAETFIDGTLVKIVSALVPDINERIVTNIVLIVIPDNHIHNTVQLLSVDEVIIPK